MLDKEKLLELYPGYTSVLGPYLRKDGRKHVVLNNKDLPKSAKNKTKTISYPKALVEVREGRKLVDNETADHRDRDFTNDDLNNLDILDRKKHASLDSLRVKVEKVNCVGCGKEIALTKNQHNTRSTFKAGPFCSKSCSGKYGKSVQMTGETKERAKITKTYFRMDK